MLTITTTNLNQLMHCKMQIKHLTFLRHLKPQQTQHLCSLLTAIRRIHALSDTLQLMDVLKISKILLNSVEDTKLLRNVFAIRNICLIALRKTLIADPKTSLQWYEFQ